MNIQPHPWARPLLTALAVAGGGIAYAAVVMQSTSYVHMPEVLDKSGGVVTSTSYDNLGAVDEHAIGPATSSSYQSDVGFLYLLNSAPWVVILQPPTPTIVGGGGSATMTWQSQYAGTYTITQGTTTIAAGSVAAATPVISTVPASLLAADSTNPIILTVTGTTVPAGITNPMAVSTSVIDDRTAPTISAFDLTRVTGRVTDPAITTLTIKIAGQPDAIVPVTGGAFTYSYPAGTNLITIEGNGFTRVVEVLP